VAFHETGLFQRGSELQRLQLDPRPGAIQGRLGASLRDVRRGAAGRQSAEYRLPVPHGFRAREVGGDCEERGGVDRLLEFQKRGSRRDAAGRGVYGRVERAARVSGLSRRGGSTAARYSAGPEQARDKE